jgi:hypothetical protein
MKNNYENCGPIYSVFEKPRGGRGIFECEICGKKMKRLNKTHFKKHGLSKEEYFKIYSLKNIPHRDHFISTKIINKVQEFYIHDRNRALRFNTSTNTYFEEKCEGDKKCIFHEYYISQHFLGESIYGVYYWKYSTKFLVFDVDTYNDCLKEGRIIAKSIKNFLVKNIPSCKVYINFSGHKGFHVTIFFNKPFEISKTKKLFNLVLYEIKADRYSNTIVESRPEGNHSKGVKLPLCVNFRNTNVKDIADNSNFAYYLDDDMNIVTDEVNFFLNLEKTDTNLIEILLCNSKFSKGLKYNYNKTLKSLPKNPSKKTGPASNNLNKTTALASLKNKTISISNDYSDSALQRYLKNGLIMQGMRHDVSFRLALLLRDNGHSKNEIYNILHPWSLEQMQNNMSKSSIYEIEKDLNNIVYHMKESYVLYRNNPAAISSEEMIYFKILNNIAIKTKKSMNSKKKVFFALLIHMKRHAKYGKDFFMTYEHIRNLSGVTGNSTIYSTINELERYGFIKIISRGIINEANHYLIEQLNDESKDNKYFNICPNEKICSDCIFKMYSFFFDKKNISEVTTGSEKRKLTSKKFICKKIINSVS